MYKKYTLTHSIEKYEFLHFLELDSTRYGMNKVSSKSQLVMTILTYVSLSKLEESFKALVTHYPMSLLPLVVPRIAVENNYPNNNHESLLTDRWMHEFEGNVGDQFATQSTTVEFHADGVRDDDTHIVVRRLAFGDHRRGREIDVVVLENSKKSRQRHYLKFDVDAGAGAPTYMYAFILCM